jgi:hypothetical protein
LSAAKIFGLSCAGAIGCSESVCIACGPDGANASVSSGRGAGQRLHRHHHTKNGRIVTIEIETGKSNWQNNLQKNISKGFKEIL